VETKLSSTFDRVVSYTNPYPAINTEPSCKNEQRSDDESDSREEDHSFIGPMSRAKKCTCYWAANEGTEVNDQYHRVEQKRGPSLRERYHAVKDSNPSPNDLHILGDFHDARIDEGNESS
jgi:hypothetical protein